MADSRDDSTIPVRDALLVMDEDGRVADWNSRAQAIFGWSRDEALGHELAELIIPERFRAAHNQGFKRFLKTGQAALLNRAIELVALRRDGTEFPLEVVIAEVKSPEGRRFTARARDLSADKRAQRELTESEEKFRVIFEAGTDAISIHGPNSVFRDVNDEFVRVTGFSRAEVIGKTPEELGLFEELPAVGRIADGIARSGLIRNYEVRLRAKDGSSGWGLFSARLVTIGGERCVLAIIRDITTLKLVEAELRESEEKFRKIFEKASVGIAIISIPEGRFLDVNDEFLRLGALRREEIAGKTMGEIGRSAQQELLERTIAETLAAGSVHNLEAEVAGRSGRPRVMLFSATVLDIRGQRCILAFVRDITDRKRLESALVEAGQAAMAAAQSKTELLAWMSHEIRTPMNAILGMADLLWDTPLSREQRELVRIFRSTGGTLLNLVDGILDLSRAEAGRLSLKAAPFNVRELVASVIEILALRANRKGLRLTTEIDRRLPANLLGDALRLREVLLNIVENAIKFTETGTISIRACRDGASPEMLHFSVADTGIGIPADKLDSIFLSFTQLEFSGRRRYGGSGLGLSIAKSLVELMGGTIRVESDLSRGSVFHFTVPLRTADGSHAVSEAADERPARLELPPDGRPVRILLAEDSDDNSFLVESYLRGTPCALDIAENGAVALAKFKRERYDLVLMDMGMPVMDGYATVGEMRRFERENGRRPTPIVALTAYALPEDFERTRTAGCDAYLTKPVRKATLLDMIREFTHEFQ